MFPGYTQPRRMLMRTPTPQPGCEEVARRPMQTTFVDMGLPIPESYDVDLLSVLVQSPVRLYAFWQISPGAWKDLENVFPASDVKHFRTVVKLRHPASGWEGTYQAGPATNWWFEVYPGQPYQVEVGFYSPKHGYIRWLRSRQVRTPRVGPGIEPLPPVQPPPVAPPPSPPADIRRAAETVPRWVDELPDWLRPLLHKLFRGEPLDEEDVRSLPDWLQYQLLALWSGVGPEAMRRAFLEYVPELVQEVSPETYEKIIESQRQEFRLAQVGSEVMALPPFGHRWVPGLLPPGGWPWGAAGSLFRPRSGEIRSRPQNREEDVG